MTKPTLNEAFFEKNMPTPSEGFEERTLSLLRAEAARERAATEDAYTDGTRMQARKRKRARLSPRLVLVIVLLLTLLVATAVAVGLRYSARYNAINEAQETILSHYGLTEETLALFYPTISENQNTLTIQYKPSKFDLEAMGEYTAVIPFGGEPAVSWTYDGFTPEGSADGFMPWDQGMLQKALDMEKAYGQDLALANATDRTDWTLEELAERDRALSESEIEAFVRHVAPREEDFSQEEAVAKAKAYFVQAYGMQESALQGMEADVSLLKYSGEEEPVYVIHFGDEDQHFYIRMHTPSETVERALWDVLPEKRTLPEGDLKNQRDAAQSYVETGAFGLLTPAEKAEAAERITKAGYGELIENKQYIAPTESDLPEAEAATIAREALKDAYRMAESSISTFYLNTALLLEDEGRIWEVRLVPKESEWVDLIDYQERLGVYTVRIAAVSGALLDTEWSNAEIAGGEVTETTWGPQHAIPAYALPWALDFKNKLQDIGTEYPDDWQSILEWEAAVSAVYRSVGYPQSQSGSSLPGEGDLPLEEALALAKEALRQEHGIMEDCLSDESILPAFYEEVRGKPVWWFTFFVDVDGAGGDYSVSLDAKTGEILSILFSLVGNG